MIQTAENKIVYNITGTTGNVYPFPIRFFKVSDVHVFVDDNGTETELARGKDYTIEPKADYSGGADITLITAPPIGCRLVIMRILPIAQTLNLPEQGKFPSTSMEIALDKITMICQQLAEAIDRSIKWSPGQDQDTPPNQLLIAALEAAKKILALYPDILKVATDVNNALAAAGVMAEDTTLHYYSLSWDTEDDWDAVHARARQIMAEIAALPRNLGGHTLRITFYNWKLTGDESCIIQIGGFYNGKVIIDAPTFYCPVDDEIVGDGNRYSAFILENCQCPVEVHHLAVGTPYHTENCCIAEVRNCAAVDFYNVLMTDLRLREDTNSNIFPNLDAVAAIYAVNSAVRILGDSEISFDTRYLPTYTKCYAVALDTESNLDYHALDARVDSLYPQSDIQ